MSLWMLVVKSLYFFLPAYFANMAPVLFKWIPFLNKPIWKRRLGRNKTWRGLVTACLTGILIFLLQKWLFGFEFFYRISIIDYSDFSILLGFLFGFGAIAGDSIGSFCKRRAGINPGESWKPWDQLDFVFGGLVLSWLVYVPKIGVTIIILVLSPFLHMFFSWIGYLLRLKKSKF
jgi:CDP-2,3-bis-(O-geranylgeranyl)-sn-glycerol synthase